MPLGPGKIGVDRQRTGFGEMVRMLLRYKAWANDLVFAAVREIPTEEAYKPRPTTFGSIVQTLDHVHVIDDIFCHHLRGERHSYIARTAGEPRSLSDLHDRVRATDQWYIGTFDGYTEDDLEAAVDFQFLGGERGSMSRGEIALHVVNHCSYHRGFVGDMLKQVPYDWPANDLTVFLRDQSRG